MKNTLKLTHISILLLILLFGGCQKCKKEVKPDPCANTKRVTADFMISEIIPYTDPYWLPNDTDTSGTLYTKFTALADDCEYEWTLGNEIITTKSFSRRDFPIGVPIEITLKVKRPKDKITSQYLECFPGDKAMGEKTRTFVCQPPKIERITGKYYGVDTDRLNQQYLIEIYQQFYNPTYPDDFKYRTKGIPTQNCDLEYDRYWGGYNQVFFDFGMATTYEATTACLTPKVLFNFKKDSVIIRYWAQVQPGDNYETRVEKIFKGKKIQ